MLYEVRSAQCRAEAEQEPPARSGGAFSLIDCPPVGRGNFVLLRRDENGSATLLAMGRLQQNSETLNLAQIRRLGAELGANEVHLFPAAGT
jgi:hypothetical protein